MRCSERVPAVTPAATLHLRPSHLSPTQRLRPPPRVAELGVVRRRYPSPVNERVLNLILAATIPLSSCASAPADSDRQHRVIEYHGPNDYRDVVPRDIAFYGDQFDYQHRSPREFLDFLTRCRGAYSIHGIHVGWLRPDDVPILVALLDSTTPCAPTKSTLSSHIPSYPSTVGHEAAYLLDGFRQQRYPPSLDSSDLTPDATRKLRTWISTWKPSK